MIEITREIALKVRDVVAAGLVSGLGTPEPGKMCVEAAICFALGLPHGDDPGCVDPALRRLKIRLNDASWPSNQARATGLRRLAIAQLGSLDTIETGEFRRRVAEMTIRTMVPIALRAAARCTPRHDRAAILEAAAVTCEREGTVESARQARSAASAASATYAAATYTTDAASAAASAATYAAAADAAATDAASAASAADARVRVLTQFAESVVQILIDLKAPGCEFLDLVPLEAA